MTEAWHQRLLFCISAIIVGTISVGFGLGTTKAINLFFALTGPHPMIVFALCPIGLGVVALLTRKVFPGAQGSGIPQAMAAMEMQGMEFANAMLSWRIAIGKILLTLVGFVCGASIGKEGPTVQISCSVMNSVGRLGLKPSRDLLRLLVLCGGAAGIASAFNTPIAGAVFAIEEMAHYHIDGYVGRRLLMVTALSGMAMLALVGNYTYFGTVSAVMPWGTTWAALLPIGIVGGLLGGAFARVLIIPVAKFPRWLAWVVERQPIGFAMLCGLILATVGHLSGGLAFCSSYAQARGALHGTLLLPPSFPLLKWAATVISYMSGIPGGIFAPSLSVGAGLAYWFVPLFPHLPISALAMLCMAAYFSGVVQSPITAAVIVLEMTNNIEMTVSVSAAAALGTIFSRMICPKPIYAAMSEQFIAAVGRRKSESLAGPNADAARKPDAARTATHGTLPVGRQRRPADQAEP
ncbi:MAG TPA: chloride channel protein [Acetobacteraceae bacterium]|nr:chloride channel protein [Acetobacteraceae bacterium]